MKRWINMIWVAAVIACSPKADISGIWEFCPDPDGIVKADAPFPETIQLPGTTDLAGKGYEPERTDETLHLTRRHAYVGKAWYRKEVNVPKAWKDKDLVLYLERTKVTTLYLDGQPLGTCTDVSTPQTYRLGKLAPGPHTLALCVDNAGGVPIQVIRSSHLYSEDTQTNWNGIIGRIEFGPQELVDVKAPVTRMPRLEVKDGHFVADGHLVFLRGKHDACVFPKTGHTPMDKAAWLAYFKRCQEYGINHVRFHSWCPPEAAFAAADELGIYLQPELPFWGTLEGEELLTFLTKEGLNILQSYGHHPSFALFSLGNELWGEPSVMQEMVAAFRACAPHILYTNGTNAFLGYQGYVEGMDFMSTCRIGGEPYGEYGTHVRTSFSFTDAYEGGILNHFYPGTCRNFSQALKASPVPVISHETGQFQTYPDYAEIDKYEGTPFVPYNLMEFRRRLEAAGLADQAEAFHRASGKWSAQLYKADMEMDLRTPGFGGFQLLDLQDYPGQGSAYVGLLDAFMDDKGIVDRAEWLGFCSPVVPLAEFEKYCWSADEPFQARILLANYSGGASVKSADWTLVPDVAACQLPVSAGEGLLDLGSVQQSLKSITSPVRLNLTVSVQMEDGSVPSYVNHWPIWVYPSNNQPERNGVVITRQLDSKTMQALDKGEKVLLMPSDTTGTLGGLFQTDYWNYRMFKEISESNNRPVSPGTLGILTNPSHPVFREFPTEEHANWQWFPILKASRPLILDSLEGYKPIVQVIDNIERNHRLGLLFEFAVGKGRLLVCCSNLESTLEYPEGRQFYKSLLDYMRSDAFQPSVSLTPEQLAELFLPMLSVIR